jgi:pilus assembly protein CpaF
MTVAGIAPSTASDVDERLVHALCAAVEFEPGDTEAAVRAHLKRLAPLAGTDQAERLVRAAVARLDGLGTLDALLADPTVDEVLVNAGGPDSTVQEIWMERRGALERAGSIGVTELAVVVERILAPLGRRLDRTSPVVDARLADGTRVCAVVPPVALGGICLSLRRFRTTPLPLESFASAAGVRMLTELVDRRCNVVISGATSSGKTSLLSSLLGLLPPGERIVTLEDTAELAPVADHVVRLEARPATSDGVRAITLDDLLRTALRLRPDRLVVGEVRGDEVLGLVQALNTGHDGSLSTVHANSALDALHRLETLVVQAAPSWPLAAIRDHLARCIDVVVHVERVVGGGRRVAEIAEVRPTAQGMPAVASVESIVELTRCRRVPS